MFFIQINGCPALTYHGHSCIVQLNFSKSKKLFIPDAEFHFCWDISLSITKASYDMKEDSAYQLRFVPILCEFLDHSIRKNDASEVR